MEPFEQGTERYLKLSHWEKQYPSLVAGFTTRNGGMSASPFSSLNMGFHVQDDPEIVTKNRQLLANDLSFPLAQWVGTEQVHRSKIIRVSHEHKGMGSQDLRSAIRETDGIYTKERNVLLTSLYADCVPIYFYAPKATCIGLAHAGWRGTVDQIGPKMIRRWAEHESIPKEDILIVIGPSISRRHYEVSDIVIKAIDGCFERSFDKSLLYEQISDDHYLLDLQTVNKYLFINEGIQPSQITVSSLCTVSDERLFSHRAEDGKTGRLMSFIGMR
ncbi:peptidoglycan editing factor PgeF [Halalkalibacter hemicellulosilyticus]|uniref:Purine nucleoside phosphorylase n=1 Tax=Halalkalibacter hemicellulosilyticusJCM 9152 TaxID=1236971 RepID=W4QBU7_9BACI|nr:peptidoglycan editing factor PgeF [Halalkalibacter hemicellulosilyticus]GAE29163.1 uncharacterized conserved protein [Halalkalibacter hemicellulosilyticusJCM 9152]